MDIKQKIEMHKKLIDEMHELYINKNSDYGDSVHDTFEKFGMDSFLVRMYDKINRVYSLTHSDTMKVADEKIEDSLMDLSNYALLAIIELKNRKCDLKEENKPCQNYL